MKLNLRSFSEAFDERLRAAGVAFRESRKLTCGHPMVLMSPTPSNFGGVRACIPER